jgi:branched-chain amino acid transport system ATP-binding protein
VTAALSIDGLTARYGEFRALNDVSLSVAEGEALALVGANGAGKSTLMGILCGLVGDWRGGIKVGGNPLPVGDPYKSSELGLALVPEGRLLFDSLTVEENLLIGQTDRKGPWDLKSIQELFPILAERRRSRPSMLSGGQQQMVAIGRALASNPSILLCDEISLGLSPLVVSEVYGALARVRNTGVTMIIVDQDIARVCRATDRVACLFKGRVTHEGPARGISAGDLRAAYFGAAQ